MIMKFDSKCASKLETDKLSDWQTLLYLQYMWAHCQRPRELNGCRGKDYSEISTKWTIVGWAERNGTPTVVCFLLDQFKKLHCQNASVFLRYLSVLMSRFFSPWIHLTSKISLFNFSIHAIQFRSII